MVQTLLVSNVRYASLQLQCEKGHDLLDVDEVAITEYGVVVAGGICRVCNARSYVLCDALKTILVLQGTPKEQCLDVQATENEIRIFRPG